MTIIDLNKNNLLNCLKDFKKIISQRKTLNFFNQVHINFNNDGIYILGINDNMVAKFKISEYKVQEIKYISLEYDNLLRILESCCFDLISLNVDFKNNIIKVNGLEDRTTHFNVAIPFDVSDLSSYDFDILDYKNIIQIEECRLKEMINQVIYATAKTDIKPSLIGVLFDYSKSLLKLVACDGRRICISKEVIESVDNNYLNNIIHYDSLKRMKNILTNKTNNFTNIYSDDDKIIFELSNGYEIRINTLSEQYIDYNDTINQNILKPIKTTASIKKKELLDCLKKCSTFINAKNRSPLKITMLNKEIIISIKSDLGEFSSVLGDYNGEDLQIGINCDFLLDVVKSINSDYIYMDFVSPYSMIKIFSLNDNFEAGIMPIQLITYDI